MMQIKRKVEFCAGHRVKGHESKCANLHGHNYTVYLTCTGQQDDIGRVIDFSVIKEQLKGWIDENWDHKFLAYERDDLIASLGPFKGLVWVPFNPTAENMAQDLLHTANLLLRPRGVVCTEVELWETSTCSATVKLLEHP